MNTSTTHPALRLYRPLAVGQRVKVKSRYKRGHTGTIIEAHPSPELDGRGLYGVRLDSGSPTVTTDFQRHELTRI